MPTRRGLLGCALVCAMLPLPAVPPARAATADEFPIPQSSRFT